MLADDVEHYAIQQKQYKKSGYSHHFDYGYATMMQVQH